MFVPDESETAANNVIQGLQLDVNLRHDTLSEKASDCKITDNELNIVTETNEEKKPQVTFEITKPCHLYNVNDIPPFMTCIFSAIQVRKFLMLVNHQEKISSKLFGFIFNTVSPKSKLDVSTRYPIVIN